MRMSCPLLPLAGSVQSCHCIWFQQALVWMSWVSFLLELKTEVAKIIWVSSRNSNLPDTHWCLWGSKRGEAVTLLSGSSLLGQQAAEKSHVALPVCAAMDFLLKRVKKKIRTAGFSQCCFVAVITLVVILNSLFSWLLLSCSWEWKTRFVGQFWSFWR